MRYLIKSTPFLCACFLVLLGSVAVQANDGDCYLQKSKGDFTCTFTGEDRNPDGSATWNYTLLWDGDDEAPSRFIVELCADATVVSSNPPFDSIGFDAGAGVFGIIFDLDNFPVDTEVPFSFTLSRQYECEKIKWAVEQDGDVDRSDICGPDDGCAVLNPLPITDLVCELIDPCSCEVQVSWTDPETGEHVTLVSVDGIVVEILPGGSSGFSLTLPDSGDHEICVRNVFDLEEFEEQTGCDQCSGGVSELTLQYNGAMAVQVTAVEQGGTTVFDDTVMPGGQFTFNGTEGDGGFDGNDLELFVDGMLDQELHMSCSQPIGPGTIFGDFEVITGASVNGGPFCPCGPCDGGVTTLTLQYTGGSSVQVMAVNDGDVLFDATVAPGEEFTLNGQDNDGTFEKNDLEIFVDGMLDQEIHVSCSQPIGAGSVFGDFLVTAGASADNGPFCPPGMCGECDDRVNFLSLQFNGMTTANVVVEQKNGDVVFSGSVDPGEKFSFSGTDDPDSDCPNLDTEIEIFVDGASNTEIHTSCSQPIGPGLISGLFTVIEGTSCSGGPLCPLGPVGEEDLCEEDIDGASACVCCIVNCPDIPNTSPINLVCTPNTLDCSVDLSWENTSQYSVIVVTVNGMQVQTLPGNAMMTTIPGPILGPTEICLTGTTICGQDFPMVCCMVNCMIEPPPPVLNLNCELLDPCTCEVAMTWTNGAANYDTIEITLDGMTVASLPGNATSHNLFLPGNQPTELCVIPIRNGASGMATCCTVECPDIPPMSPINLQCEVGLPPECVVSVTWENTSQYGEIRVLLDGMVVATLPGTAEAASVQLDMPGTFEICLQGETICNEPFPEVCCTVVCPGPPQEVTDLMCELVDICTCEVLLTWTNQDPDYDMIRIYIDGVLNTSLPGDAEMLTLFLPGNGSFEICVEPVRMTLAGPQECCMVDCPDVPATPPANLMATPDTFDCSVDVTWMNTSQYAEIRVILDGMEIAVLPGDAEMFEIAGPLKGMHEVCLEGTTICGDPFETCTPFQCNIDPPDPVEDLMCEVDPCSCVATVTWVNGEDNYDSIEISLDGMVIDSLPGDATMTTVNLPDDGTFMICVTPVRFGVSGPDTCCEVTCPNTDPTSPIMLMCEVNQNDCTVLVTWVNTSTYAEIRVLLNGMVVETLPGDAVSTTVTITLPGINEICLEGETICEEPFEPECCEVECEGLVPPPVDNLVCTVDPCSCDVQMTWENGGTYDAIRILLNGALLEEIAGTATSYMFNLGVDNSREICVVPVRNGVEGEANCCNVDCPAVPPTSPTDLMCETTSPPDCVVTVTWVNTSTYAEIVVTLDGNPVATLPGNAQSAMIPLPGSGNFEICVTGTTICEEPFPPVCCDVSCGVPFIRGECNDDDRGLNVADAIFLVLFFFQNGNAPNCNAACDVNRDGGIDVSDVIFIINYLFMNGPPPSAPWPECSAIVGSDCELHNSCQP